MTLKEAIECLTNPNVHELVLPPNQLTEWLQELELLREKHWDECRQIALYDNDLKDAISLTSETVITALDNLDAKDMIRELSKYLYEAVDGFRALGRELDDKCELNVDCDKCPLRNGGNCRQWKHTKAVLKLIGGSENELSSTEKS